MAEDPEKSPRVRKLSWADMVDEEEELMLAKEAYEKALKERELKARKPKKSPEQRERTEQKKFIDPTKEFKQRDSSTERCHTEGPVNSKGELSQKPISRYADPSRNSNTWRMPAGSEIERSQKPISKYADPSRRSTPWRTPAGRGTFKTEKPMVVHPSSRSEAHNTQIAYDLKGQQAPEVPYNINILPFKSFRTEKPKGIGAPFKQEARPSKSLCDLKEQKSVEAPSNVNNVPFKDIRRKPISRDDGPSRSVPYIPLNTARSLPAVSKYDKIEAPVYPPQEERHSWEVSYCKAAQAPLDEQLTLKSSHRGDGDSALFMKYDRPLKKLAPRIAPTHPVVTLDEAEEQSAVQGSPEQESSGNASSYQIEQDSTVEPSLSTITPPSPTDEAEEQSAVQGSPIQKSSGNASSYQTEPDSTVEPFLSSTSSPSPTDEADEQYAVQGSPKHESSGNPSSHQTMQDSTVEPSLSTATCPSPTVEGYGGHPISGMDVLKHGPPRKSAAPATQNLLAGRKDENIEQPPEVRESPSLDTTSNASIKTILAHPQTVRRPALLPTPPDSERLFPPGETKNLMLRIENRFEKWGDLGDEVSSMFILKQEVKRFEDLRDDLKLIVDDQYAYDAQLDEMLKESLVLFDTHKESAIREDKIGYWKTKGLMFMVSTKFAHHAIDAFTKAVKLEPSSIDCWNNLGDCYCSLGDFEMSKKCFLSALAQEKNVVSYQNLSMLSRLKRPREIQDYQDGINYAKEALACDFSCTKSWTILGNAYMAAFFAAGQNEQYINKALHAYRKADTGESRDYEVCYNKFIALKFLEKYEEALNTLLPSLTKRDVDWKNAQANFLSLINYLKQVQELIDKKGKIRPKRRCEYIKQLKSRKLSEDERGAGTGGLPRLSGTVIWILSPDGSYPYTVGLLTESEEVIAVSVFNLVTSKGFTIGDIMNVPTSSKTELDIHICQYVFKFTKIRIFLPTDIILNGKRLTVKVLKPYEIHSN